MAAGPRPRDGCEGFLGEQRLRFSHEFHEADAIDDRPTSVAPLQTIYITSTGDRQVIRRLAVGPDEQVVGLGVGFVAVDVDGVVQQIVLVSRLVL